MTSSKASFFGAFFIYIIDGILNFQEMTKTFKTIIGCAVALITFLPESNAQSAFEAGVRIGNDLGIDATFPLSKAPRLHTSFYFKNDFAFGTYLDWLFSLEGGPQGLKFYPGVGPEFYFGDNFDVGIAGNFGAEYSFNFPLTIGIDYRPGLMITDGFSGYSNNWGITARFRFISAN
jgi:hypothetical protein